MSDIQEVYSTLTEIDRLLGDIELKINNISDKTVGGSGGGGGGAGGDLTLRQQVRTLNMMMYIVEQMTGSKDLNKGIRLGQQFIMVLMRIRMTLLVVQSLEAGTLGPIGWLYAGANALMVVSTSANMMTSIGE